MRINDFAEMNILHCLRFFHLCKIHPPCKQWKENALLKEYTLWAKNLVKITLSCIIFQVHAVLRCMQNLIQFKSDDTMNKRVRNAPRGRLRRQE